MTDPITMSLFTEYYQDYIDNLSDNDKDQFGTLNECIGMTLAQANSCLQDDEDPSFFLNVIAFIESMDKQDSSWRSSFA